MRATIVGGSNPEVRRRVAELFAAIVRRELDGRGLDAVRSRDAHARAVVGAFLALAEWWLDEAPHVPVDDVFQRLWS